MRLDRTRGSWRLVSIVLAGLGSVLVEAAPPVVDPAVPTMRIYRGQSVELQLDSGRLAVLFSTSSGPATRASALSHAGLERVLSVATGVPGWRLIELPDEMSGAAAAATRIAALVDFQGVESASPVFRGKGGGWFFPTAHLHVRLRPAAGAESLLAVLAPDLQIEERDFGDMPGVFRLRSSALSGFEVLAEANRLALDPRILWAEPDMQGLGVEHEIPDDAGFSGLWGLLNTGQFGGFPGVDIDADQAWDLSTGAGVSVLVLDDGIQSNHPDLQGNWQAGSDFTSDGPGAGTPVNACDNHGTGVAGALGAVGNNAIGSLGVAPDVSILSARTSLSNVPSCEGFTFQHSWLVSALAWGEHQGARVSNMSFGLSTCSQAIEDKLASTRANGMVHFSSAGNDADTDIRCPASLPSVNAVASIDMLGDLSSFSNFGSDLSLAAPGTLIYTTDRTGPDGDSDGDYRWANGTSQASPQAAGVAALLLSVEPTLSAADVESRLQCSSRDLGPSGFDTTYGHGVVNAYRAILAPAGTDSDADGIEDSCDNCPGVSNFTQDDADHDGVGDVCDVCPADGRDDADADGWCGPSDVCPLLADPLQSDADADGVGDACACIEPISTATGSTSDARLGWDVRGAGDVNGDGFDDYILGTPRDDQAGSNAGKFEVFSGADGSVMYRMFGVAAGIELGLAVSGAGDVNADGFGDFMAAAPFLNGAGRVYLFAGGPGTYPVTLTPGDALHTMDGFSSGDVFGWSISGAGDTNDDGFDDVIVASVWNDAAGNNAGQAHTFSGLTGLSLFTFTGEAANDWFGQDVSGAGDVNSDGFDDVIVGAQLNDAAGTDAGRAYVFSGRNGSLIRTLDGQAAGDGAGTSVAGVGDVNGDGFDDVIVGAPSSQANGESAGRADVYSGLDGSILLTLLGEEPWARLGYSVGSAGDHDGDGLPDLVVGSPGEGVLGVLQSGRVRIYSGVAGAPLRSVGGSHDGEWFGAAVDGGVDVDADGLGDLIVGAFRNDAAANDAGRVYVYTLGDLDGDGLTAACDSCPAVVDPQQVDSDGDLVGDACDNCPIDPNTDQADTDVDPSDCCCPSNGSPGCTDDVCQSCVCAIDPYCCEVEWDGSCCAVAENQCADQCVPVCEAGLYDGWGDVCDCAPNDAAVFAGPVEVSNLRFLVDGSSIEWDSLAPLAGSGVVYDVIRGNLTGLPVGGGAGEECIESGASTPAAVAGSDPAPGAGFYYLVRGTNSCAVGTYGTATAGLERITNACP